MTTEIKRIKVDRDTRLGPILEAVGSEPVIIEYGDAAFRVNPIGSPSSPFTVETAYNSIQTIDGRRGMDISAEELEEIIDEAKDRYIERLIEEYDREQ